MITLHEWEIKYHRKQTQNKTPNLTLLPLLQRYHFFYLPFYTPLLTSYNLLLLFFTLFLEVFYLLFLAMTQRPSNRHIALIRAPHLEI